MITGYDSSSISSINPFHSDYLGRLYQVEYAIEALNKTPPAVGMLCTDGVILLAEKRNTTPLMEPMSETEKIHKIDNNTIVAVAGLTADANQLIQQARQFSQQHLYVYQTYPPTEETVVKICDTKQSYTQFGGLRPFGVGFLVAGYDKKHGFQLFFTNPAGSYSGWLVKIIGQGSVDAQRKLKESSLNKKTGSSEELLDDEPVPENTIEEGLPMCAKMLADALGVDQIESKAIEAAIIRKKQGGTAHEIEYVVLDQAKLAEIAKVANEKLESVAKGDQ